MKIWHHNDMDGRCAAAIVALYGPQQEVPEFIEIDYKTPPDLSGVRPGEPVYIVDFSFKPEVMSSLLAITDKVTWIDHHASAKDYGYADKVMGLQDFSERSKRSGAMLAWEYFRPEKDVPRAVLLVSDYDTWTAEVPASFEFMEGLKLEHHDPGNCIWEDLFKWHDEPVNSICEAGRTATKYRENYCAEMRQSFGYPCKFEGYNCYAMNVYRFGGLAFGPELKSRDICIAFVSDARKVTVSLYTERDDIDVSALAKKYGGGGHRKAAGFVLDTGFKYPWDAI